MIPTNDQIFGDNSEFFDSVFNTYQRTLYAYLLGQTGNRENAEDLLQQVFVRVWQHIEEAKRKPESGLKYWLFAIAANLLIDFRRKQSRQNVLQHSLVEESPTPTKDIAENVAEKDLLIRISRAIQNLPKDLRTSFTMTVLGEMNSEEVGKVLGKPAGTIRYQVSEARKRIAEEVGI